MPRAGVSAAARVEPYDEAVEEFSREDSTRSRAERRRDYLRAVQAADALEERMRERPDDPVLAPSGEGEARRARRPLEDSARRPVRESREDRLAPEYRRRPASREDRRRPAPREDYEDHEPMFPRDLASSNGGIPGRRTVTIQGRGAERYTPARRRPDRTLEERARMRPDRAAMWAVMLGVLLILAAATSSHAAVRGAGHVPAPPPALIRVR